MKNFITVVLMLMNVISVSAKSNLPRSREAVLLESSSPTEVMIRATGYGVITSIKNQKQVLWIRALI